MTWAIRLVAPMAQRYPRAISPDGVEISPRAASPDVARQMLEETRSAGCSPGSATAIAGVAVLPASVAEPMAEASRADDVAFDAKTRLDVLRTPSAVDEDTDARVGGEALLQRIEEVGTVPPNDDQVPYGVSVTAWRAR